jgi:hypothetical protein
MKFVEGILLLIAMTMAVGEGLVARRRQSNELPQGLFLSFLGGYFL